MYPAEREYRVGAGGFVDRRAGGYFTRFEPGALVWLRGIPPSSADLQPTGRERAYETKARVRS